MIRINLLPTKEKAEAAQQRQEVSLFGMALIALVGVCALLSFNQSRRLSGLDHEIETLQATLKSLESKVKDVADLDQKRKDLDAKLKVIADLGHKRIGPAEALKDLGGATPDRAWLTEFTEVAGGATLTGQAVDNQTIAEFLRELDGSEYFKSVDLVETTAATEAGAEVRLRKFIMKAVVDYASKGRQQTQTAGTGGASG